MGLNEKDIEDVRSAKPVSVTDIWDIDDRIDRLETIIERLEKTTEGLFVLYKQERVKNWELILKEMMRQADLKKERRMHYDRERSGDNRKC